MDKFKDTFAQVCTLPERSKEDFRMVDQFECTSIDDFDKEFKKTLKEAQPALGDPKDSERYKNYANELEKMAFETNNTTAGPSLLNLADDMQVEEQNVLEMIDPVSKRQIINPVRNKICNHVYEEETVKGAIKMNSRVKCPYLGCGNKKPMTINDLVKDDELRLKIDTARTQQQEMSMAMDGDESD